MIKANPKAQGLSLSTIVVAVIVLLVLVVLVMIFTGRIGMFRQGVSACASSGGNCRLSCGSYEKPVSNYDCDLDGDGTFNEAGVDGVCCMGFA